jgi:hypothetical protein
MQLPDAKGARPLVGTALAAATMVSITAGAVSLIDASDTWQDVLNRAWAAEPARFVPCPGQFSVSGWGDAAVLVMLGLALAMLGVAMVAVRHGYARHGLGGATGVAAAVVSLILWLDAYTVSQSQLGDCDGIGLSGPASVAVNRAGWLLFASVLLSLATATWFQGGAREWFR